MNEKRGLSGSKVVTVVVQPQSATTSLNLKARKSRWTVSHFGRTFLLKAF